MEFTTGQIAHLLGGTLEGDDSLKVNQLTKIEEGTAGSIAFLSNPKYEPYLYTTAATAVIVDTTFQPRQPLRPVLIRVNDPYSAFTRLLEEYRNWQAQRVTEKMGTEQPSFAGEGTTFGAGGYRGAFSYVGARCTIGQHVRIHPHVTIGEGVTIGDYTTIYSGARIYDGCVIGSHCVVHANAVIGADGFGFAPQPDGTYRTIPQLGNVVLEDGVSVGAGTTIDRATMGSTLIRQGVKLDNLIQVGHNVEIGKNTVIAAQVGISGSAKIGENCMIGGQAGIAGHISIANRTIVTGKTGVSKSIKKEGLVLAGNPVTENSEFLKSQAIFRRLPQLEKRVHTVEKSLNELSLPANEPT
jgi:UDP-3-O-[3-hydroxymyristoyl] glucosamine N-acyltransferase